MDLVDILIKQMEISASKFRNIKGEDRKYLLSTGFYTKNLKLKKKFK